MDTICKLQQIVKLICLCFYTLTIVVNLWIPFISAKHGLHVYSLRKLFPLTAPRCSRNVQTLKFAWRDRRAGHIAGARNTNTPSFIIHQLSATSWHLDKCKTFNLLTLFTLLCFYLYMLNYPAFKAVSFPLLKNLHVGMIIIKYFITRNNW